MRATTSDSYAGEPTASDEPERTSTSLRLAASANGWGYRPQLDGLRAVAVYLVVAYHAGSWRMQGGFIGVDLFFVLSGFLVSNVILTDIAVNGRLRLATFYARRARRLLPAAAAAILGTSLIGVLVANPLDRLSWVGDARASSLWFANWHFIAKADDYFRSDDATSPFQHFWSLAIEEQFYLVFPLLLLGAWTLFRGKMGRLLWVTAGAVAVGVALQVALAADDANRAYLGTDARAYQVLLGVFMALAVWHRRLPDRFVRWAPALAAASLVGFVLLASSAVQVSASTRGLAAAVVAGTLILSLQSTPRGATSRLMSWEPVRYLGQISYGTYLWHWPLVVLTLAIADASPIALFAISALGGTALAALSHTLIERPIRASAHLEARPRVAIAAGLGIALAGGLVMAPGLLRADRPPSITAHASPLLGEGPSQPVPQIDWSEAALAPPGNPRCDQPDGSDCIVTEGSSGSILLMGDSYARMLLPTLTHIASQRDLELSLAYSTACPWMSGSLPAHETVGQDRCAARQERLYAGQITALDPDIVVVAQYPYSLNAGLTSSDPLLADVPAAEIMESQMRESSRFLVEPGRKLVLVEPIPTFDEDPLSCLSGVADAQRCMSTPRLSSVEEGIARALAAEDDRITAIDLDPLVCPRLPICDPIQRDYPVWRDATHLTTRFAAFLGPLLDDELARRGVFDNLARP